MVLREILAIEVTAAAVRALRLGGMGPGRCIRAYCERSLPPELLMPSHSDPNVRDEAAFMRLLAEVVGGRRPARARLVLPDVAVRLQVLLTDEAPAGTPDLERFLVWRLKDTLPFSARDARIAFVAAPDGLPTRRVAITLVARNHVLAQYERLLGSLGIAVVHAAPAACHVFNLVARTRETPGDTTHALLNLAPGSATLILCQRGVPHYARTFPWPDDERQAALRAELFRTFEHAADTAGLAAPAILWLAGDVGPNPTSASELSKTIGIPCHLVPLPAHRAWQGGQLPPQASAVFSAALAHV